MLIVESGRAAVERVLVAGELRCPSCRGELRPWGSARTRPRRECGAENRMSSGSYMPGPVRAVEIPKDHGAGVRVLGVPNTADRVSQTAAAMLLEEKLEPILHPDVMKDRGAAPA